MYKYAFQSCLATYCQGRRSGVLVLSQNRLWNMKTWSPHDHLPHRCRSNSLPCVSSDISADIILNGKVWADIKKNFRDLFSTKWISHGIWQMAVLGRVTEWGQTSIDYFLNKNDKTSINVLYMTVVTTSRKHRDTQIKIREGAENRLASTRNERHQLNC